MSFIAMNTEINDMYDRMTCTVTVAVQLNAWIHTAGFSLSTSLKRYLRKL